LNRLVRALGGLLGIGLLLGSAPTLAEDDPEFEGALEASAPGDEPTFVPLSGLLVYPYATDEVIGAGLQVGFRHRFLALVFRESFLHRGMREEDGALVRLRSRISFELSLEPQVQFGHLRAYAGAGLVVRQSRWETTRVRPLASPGLEPTGFAFTSTRHSELEVHPGLTLGVIGRLVEATALIVPRRQPEVRFGLGLVMGR
jgi:hypothetical protein